MNNRLLTFIFIFCILVGLSSCASDRFDSFEKRESRNNEIAGEVPTEKTDDNTDFDEYDLVIVRYYNAAPTVIVADALTEELGWKIKIVTYNQGDYYKLNTKLLAGDDDFDLYIDYSSDFSKYMVNGFYTDLKQFEGLKERMSSNRLVDFAADYNGEYIGLPMNLKYNDELFAQNQSPTILDYCAKNIDALEKRFSDLDGEKLYEVLRYVYDNDGDKKEDAREYLDFSYVQSSYCIMSPKSKHKDNAVLFLERMYDAMINLPDDPYYQQYPEHYPLYPDVGDADLSNAYLTWKFMGPVRGPVIDAYLAALESDGSDSTLKKLAKEAASGMKLRMME